MRTVRTLAERRAAHVPPTTRRGARSSLASRESLAKRPRLVVEKVHAQCLADRYRIGEEPLGPLQVIGPAPLNERQALPVLSSSDERQVAVVPFEPCRR